MQLAVACMQCLHCGEDITATAVTDDILTAPHRQLVEMQVDSSQRGSMRSQ